MERWVSSARPSGYMGIGEAVAASPGALVKSALTAPQPAPGPHMLFPGRYWEVPAAEAFDLFRYRTDPLGGAPELFRGNDYY